MPRILLASTLGLLFALSWGAFPTLTAYYAQAERLDHMVEAML